MPKYIGGILLGFKVSKLLKLIIFTSLIILMHGCSLFPVEEEELAPPIVEAKLEYRTVEVRVGTIIKEIKNQIGQFTIPGGDRSQLYFEYTGKDVELLKIGMPAVVRYNNVEYPGEVYQTSAETPVGTKVYARLRVYNVPASVKINGQKGSFTAEIERKENVLKIYKNLINTAGGKTTVQVLQDDIKAVRQIETGFESNSEIEIISGLEAGELVIVP